MKTTITVFPILFYALITESQKKTEQQKRHKGKLYLKQKGETGLSDMYLSDMYLSDMYLRRITEILNRNKIGNFAEFEECESVTIRLTSIDKLADCKITVKSVRVSNIHKVIFGYLKINQ